MYSKFCPFHWSRPRSRLWVLKLPIYNFLVLLMYCCYYLCLRKWDPLSGTASSLRAFKGNHLEALVLSDLGKEGHWLLWEALWWWQSPWLWDPVLPQELWLPRGKSSLCEVLISWCSSFFPARTLVDCSIPANWELEDEIDEEFGRRSSMWGFSNVASTSRMTTFLVR